MSYNILNELKPLFYPRSIAVAGVSAKDEKPGNRFIKVLRTYGYTGKIFIVHPTASEIDGINAYPSLEAIPEKVDLVNINTPAQHVPQIIADCVDKGIPAAEIFTSGFREVGKEGNKLEQAVKEAAQGKIRIVGPNCFGVYCPAGGLTLLPGPNYPKESGNVGVISQSGGWVTDFIWGADAYHVKFSKVISYGNGIDLNEVSLLEYLSEDTDTKIISAYLEGINDGKRFLEIARCLQGKKPLIIWKGGLSSTGKRAVNSHTGSIAGEQSTWNAFFKQTGAVQVNSFEELLDTTAIFTYLQPGSYRNLALIGGGGGVGVAAGDICEKFNLNIPPSTTDILRKIRTLLPPQGTSIRNPFDMGSPHLSAAILKQVIEILLEWENIDLIVVNRLFFYGNEQLMGEKIVEEDRRADAIIRMKKKAQKPLVAVLEELASGPDMIGLEMDRRKVRTAFLNEGIFTTASLFRLVRALSNFCTYWEKASLPRER